MDYVQEELLRQQRALSRLLLGRGGAPSPEEETAEAVERREGAGAVPAPPGRERAAALSAAARRRQEAAEGLETDGVFPQTTAPAARWSLALERASEAARRELPEEEAFAGTDVRRSAGPAAAGGRDARIQMAEAAPEGTERGGPRREGSSGGISGTETAGWNGAGPAEDPGVQRGVGTPSAAVRQRTVTELLWPGEGQTTDAKALSRTFQRDARRYDGGFLLY